MPLYSVQASYSSASWKHQVEAQPDARARVSGLVESLGGRFVDAYYTFGDHDILIIAELPDNATAAAVSIAASAGGALTSIKTTPLLTLEEGKQVLTKAGQGKYKAPVG